MDGDDFGCKRHEATLADVKESFGGPANTYYWILRKFVARGRRTGSLLMMHSLSVRNYDQRIVREVNVLALLDWLNGFAASMRWWPPQLLCFLG